LRAALSTTALGCVLSERRLSAVSARLSAEAMKGISRQ
jgi:hypothetical protein